MYNNSKDSNECRIIKDLEYLIPCRYEKDNEMSCKKKHRMDTRFKNKRAVSLREIFTGSNVSENVMYEDVPDHAPGYPVPTEAVSYILLVKYHILLTIKVNSEVYSIKAGIVDTDNSINNKENRKASYDISSLSELLTTNDTILAYFSRFSNNEEFYDDEKIYIIVMHSLQQYIRLYSDVTLNFMDK